MSLIGNYSKFLEAENRKNPNVVREREREREPPPLGGGVPGSLFPCSPEKMKNARASVCRHPDSQSGNVIAVRTIIVSHHSEGDQMTTSLTVRDSTSIEHQTYRAGKRARNYQRQATSGATQRAYQSDLRHIGHWLAAEGLIPAAEAESIAAVHSATSTPAIVQDYLAHYAEALKPATLTRRVAAIAKLHERVAAETGGVNSHPTKSPAVKETLAGIRRSRGVRQTKALALTEAELRQITDALNTDSLQDLRDRALLMIGWRGALRRSEIVALKVENLETAEAGLILHIEHSKTDQDGEGQMVPIFSKASIRHCPIAALQRYLDTAGITEGTIFPLTAQSVSLILARAAERAGLDPDRIAGLSAHSLRAGYATQAAANGYAAEQIAVVTRHRDLRVLYGYIRPAQLHAGAPDF